MRGTVAELRAAGHARAACRLTIEGDLPHGAGLSSSAALEAALCLALLEDPDATASSSRSSARAWRTTTSARKTGLLDQLAVLCGEDGHARCGSTSATSRSSRCRSSSAAGGSSRSTRAPPTSTPAAATTSAAPSAPPPARRSGSRACARRPRRRRAPRAARPPRAPRAHRERPRRRDRRSAGRRRPARPAALLDASHASLRDDYEASVPEVERTVAALRHAGRRRRPDGRRRLRRLGAGAVRARRAAAGRRASQSPPAPPPAASDSCELLAQRARERPEQEERADDQHRQPGPQVHVDAGRLVDVGVGRPEPEHEQDRAVEHEQPADEAADVEQVGGAGVVLGVALRLRRPRR